MAMALATPAMPTTLTAMETLSISIGIIARWRLIPTSSTPMVTALVTPVKTIHRHPARLAPTAPTAPAGGVIARLAAATVSAGGVQEARLVAQAALAGGGHLTPPATQVTLIVPAVLAVGRQAPALPLATASPRGVQAARA